MHDLVEDERGGDAEVEGVDAAAHGDGDEAGAEGLLRFAEALALAAHQQDCARAVVRASVGGLGGVGGSDDGGAGLASPFGEGLPVGADDLLREDGAGAGAHSGAVPRVCADLEEDDAGRAGGVRGAEDCAEVARVLDRGKGDPAIAILKFDGAECPPALADDGGDALRAIAVGERLEDLPGHVDALDAGRLSGGNRLASAIAGELVGGDEEQGDVGTGLDRTEDGADALDVGEPSFVALFAAFESADGADAIIGSAGDHLDCVVILRSGEASVSLDRATPVVSLDPATPEVVLRSGSARGGVGCTGDHLDCVVILRSGEASVSLDPAAPVVSLDPATPEVVLRSGSARGGVGSAGDHRWARWPGGGFVLPGGVGVRRRRRAGALLRRR